MFVDLHIHSRFSRACSKDINIENLEKWARIKGIDLLGTGDFTHPEWIKELKSELKEDGTGILRTKTGFPFVLQSEVSLMYTENGRRSVHLVLLAPNGEVVDQITDYLKSKGRIDYDGRPIFGINAVEFVESLMSISKDIEVIPAHIWTSWFGALGSKSGFDSLKDCFQDQVKNIHAFETGLSSNPEMNWRVSSLDKFSILSFSDSHSLWPWRLGRELTMFENNLDYKEILKAIRENTIKGTVEVDPSYGKYHVDGHRNCGIVFEPEESKKHNNICPKCGKELTIGVLNRVEELADREEGYKPESAKPYYSLIPLSELIAFVLGKGIGTQAVKVEFDKLISKFGNELNILVNVSKEELKGVVHEKIADVIMLNREGKLNFKPGYDGVYGEIISSKQKSLSDF